MSHGSESDRGPENYDTVVSHGSESDRGPGN